MSNRTKPNIVSILTFDRLSLTKKAVTSVLEKSVEDTRLVFLDNGSSDGTRDYLNELKKSYSDKVDCIFSEENLGVAKGRNNIFRYLFNKYGDNFSWVLNLDNDCQVRQGYDSAITNCIKETGALIVVPKLIQPDESVLFNPENGFLINLKEMYLKVPKTGNPHYLSSEVSKRTQMNLIFGVSAKTPSFFGKIGFYDEAYKIGLEDFSLALKVLGLSKDDFLNWRKKNKSEGWIPLKNLMNGKIKSDIVVMYEPGCMIDHNHPKTKEYRDYQRIRRDPKTIEKSVSHFVEIWGIKPCSNEDEEK